MPFSHEQLDIPDVVLIKPQVFADERGFFAETYNLSDFGRMGIQEHFVQDNHSMSKKGVLRGLHYQLHPKAQGKLVRVIRGEIFDVAVDIRRGSPYYGKWVGVKLSESNKNMLWIPKGFAHGFLSLAETTEVLYKATQGYAPMLDRGILWNDPEIGIEWPFERPLLSSKDSQQPLLRDADNNFTCGEDQ